MTNQDIEEKKILTFISEMKYYGAPMKLIGILEFIKVHLTDFFFHIKFYDALEKFNDIEFEMLLFLAFYNSRLSRIFRIERYTFIQFIFL